MIIEPWQSCGHRFVLFRFVESYEKKRQIVVVPEKKKKKKLDIATSDGKGAATKTQAEILDEQRRKAKKLHGVKDKKSKKPKETKDKKPKRAPKRKAKPKS